jgi:hypothetical protein
MGSSEKPRHQFEINESGVPVPSPTPTQPAGGGVRFSLFLISKPSATGNVYGRVSTTGLKFLLGAIVH